MSTQTERHVYGKLAHKLIRCAFIQWNGKNKRTKRYWKIFEIWWSVRFIPPDVKETNFNIGNLWCKNTLWHNDNDRTAHEKQRMKASESGSKCTERENKTIRELHQTKNDDRKKACSKIFRMQGKRIIKWTSHSSILHGPLFTTSSRISGSLVHSTPFLVWCAVYVPCSWRKLSLKEILLHIPCDVRAAFMCVAQLFCKWELPWALRDYEISARERETMTTSGIRCHRKTSQKWNLKMKFTSSSHSYSRIFFRSSIFLRDGLSCFRGIYFRFRE